MMSLKEFVCNDCGFEFEDDDAYECPDCSSSNVEETYLDDEADVCEDYNDEDHDCLECGEELGSCTCGDEDESPDYDDMSGDFEEEDEEPSRDVGFTDEDKEAFAIADAIDSIEDEEGEKIMRYTFKDAVNVNWGIEEDEEDISVDKMNSLKMIGYNIEGDDDPSEFCEGFVKFKDNEKEYEVEICVEEGCISLNTDDVFKDNYTETEISIIDEWFENFTDLIKCIKGEK